MSDEFPYYCSLGLVGYAACPDKSKPWYCYMGPGGRALCARNGYIPEDAITTIPNTIIDAAEGAANAAGTVARNLDLILKVAAFGGAALVILYAAKTIKDITH